MIKSIVSVALTIVTAVVLVSCEKIAATTADLHKKAVEETVSAIEVAHDTHQKAVEQTVNAMEKGEKIITFIETGSDKLVQTEEALKLAEKKIETVKKETEAVKAQAEERLQNAEQRVVNVEISAHSTETWLKRFLILSGLLAAFALVWPKIRNIVYWIALRYIKLNPRTIIN